MDTNCQCFRGSWGCSRGRGGVDLPVLGGALVPENKALRDVEGVL